MAQRILGIDIGSQSVKAVILENTFKKTVLRTTKIFHFSSGTRGEPDSEDLKEIILRIGNDPALKATTVIVGIGDINIFKKFLNFPFDDRKKIDSTIGFQFEEIIPVPASELIIDYQLIKTTNDKNTFYCFAVKKNLISKLLDLFKAVGMDPSYIIPGSLAFLNFPMPEAEEKTESVSCFIDIGYSTTEFLFTANNIPLMARTIMHGGADVLASISEKANVSLVEAERIMKEECETRWSKKELSSFYLGFENHVFTVMRQFSVQQKMSVDTVYLVGGAGLMCGFDEFLKQETGIDVVRPSLNKMLIGDEQIISGNSGNQEQSAIFVKALLLAKNGISGQHENRINLRRGEFEYSGGYKYLLDRIGVLSVLLLFLIGAFGFKVYVNKRILENDYASMTKSVENVSKTFLKKKISDFDELALKLKTKSKKNLASLIPEKDGFDAYMEISLAIEALNGKKLPGIKTTKVNEPSKEEKQAVALLGGETNDLHKDKMYIELYRVTLEKDTVNITAEANTMDTIEQFIEQLKQARCYKHVMLENSEVITFKRHKGWRRFKVGSKFVCSKKKGKKAKKTKKKIKSDKDKIKAKLKKSDKKELKNKETK